MSFCFLFHFTCGCSRMEQMTFLFTLTIYLMCFEIHRDHHDELIVYHCWPPWSKYFSFFIFQVLSNNFFTQFSHKCACKVCDSARAMKSNEVDCNAPLPWLAFSTIRIISGKYITEGYWSAMKSDQPWRESEHQFYKKTKTKTPFYNNPEGPCQPIKRNTHTHGCMYALESWVFWLWCILSLQTVGKIYFNNSIRPDTHFRFYYVGPARCHVQNSVSAHKGMIDAPGIIPPFTFKEMK